LVSKRIVKQGDLVGKEAEEKIEIQLWHAFILIRCTENVYCRKGLPIDYRVPIAS
jgi:hypothetical protein